ncbi:MAG: hypothetical protein MUF18_02915 [Fimbriiglobus sp.]|nr:hypothetical protein [Fimbriiglobus sp.]
MPRFVCRVALIWPVVLVAAAAGCFGGAHNPGYFPNWLPPGDIIQTHAKPPGGAYYRDFDTRAVRLEVTPASCSNKPGFQQVLVATVYDKDGTPRRGRRVEWMLDGPGQIIEVDESGWTAGRGYKVNNKYAVSYTNMLEHTFTRGNNDPKDDFTLAPGQTWCVVSSAVPGETVVTAYAPGVFDWDKGRVNVRMNWGDVSNFEFPTPTTARFGGQAALHTAIRSIAAKEGVNPADLRVRYRAAGGLPVDFVPPPGTVGARAGADFLELPADSDGTAAVKVKQVEDSVRPGKSDISIEVIKAEDDGKAKVVGRSRTSVEWVAPTLQLDVLAPKSVAIGREAAVTLVATNTGKVDGSPGTVEAAFETGLEVGGATPAPDVKVEQYRKVWRLPALAPGEKFEIRLPVQPAQAGTFKLAAAAATDDGLTARKGAAIEAGNAGLKLALDPTYQATVGERVPVRLSVTNPGGVPLDAATAFVTFGPGLEHDTGQEQVEATVGLVPPGETRIVTVPLIARKPGQYRVAARVRAGDLADEGQTTIDVRKAELAATITGPERLSPGADGVYEIGIANRGDITIPNVTVRAVLPGAMSATRASDGGTLTGTSAAVWRMGDLPPNTSKVLKLTTHAERMVEKASIGVTASSGDAPNPKDPKAVATAAYTTVRADAAVSIQGVPALLLDLADPQESVPVGRRAGYRITVKNQGTGPAKNVRVTAIVPDEYANVKGLGPNREAVKPEGSKLIFPVVKELPAGASVVMTFEVEGAKAGDARTRAEVIADHTTKPMSEEQSTKVVERNR